MFSYFHKNKLRYNKGQLMPLFIAVLAVIIIMAIATINLSKVAQIRTEASNGVDAGALAGGSVMANVFNQVAVSNEDMMNLYILFMVKMGISFTIAGIYLAKAILSASAAEISAGLASAGACSDPCWTGLSNIAKAIKSTAAAIASLKLFTKIMMAISLAYTAYKIAQASFYGIIRDMAEKGWKNAIKIAHGFNFTNSKTGSKLKSKQLAALEDREDSNNYYDAFSDFMDSIGENNQYSYPWTDGQGRSHSTVSTVNIQPVDDFKLKVMFNPSPVETLAFLLIYGLGYFALDELAFAEMMYANAAKSLGVACGCIPCCGPGACPCPCLWPACAMAVTEIAAALTSSGLAIIEMAIIIPLLVEALAGMAPAWDIDDKGAEANIFSMWTICWIKDINHDRKVRVYQDQYHAGADLGLWKTQYPDTHSYSRVDFTGSGSIEDFDPSFDPSIDETDQIGGE